LLDDDEIKAFESQITMSMRKDDDELINDEDIVEPEDGFLLHEEKIKFNNNDEDEDNNDDDTNINSNINTNNINNNINNSYIENKQEEIRITHNDNKSLIKSPNNIDNDDIDDDNIEVESQKEKKIIH